MPLLNGHHGKRHHLITSMRTKEFLKLFYPSLVPDHTHFPSPSLPVDDYLLTRGEGEVPYVCY